MTTSYAAALKNAKLDQMETTIGTGPLLRIYNGTMPATADTALSGNTLLAVGTLPSDWMANASGGTKAKTGTWTLTGQSGAGSGTAGTFYRVYDSTGTTCYIQGTVGVQVSLTTNALTAANGSVLNFAASTGVAVGMNISGTGVPTGATVSSLPSTNVQMDRISTAGVASSASITFTTDMTLDNNSIANSQTITVNSYSWTSGN